MKIPALLISIFALLQSAVALKNEVCGLKPFANGFGSMLCYASFRVWSYDSAAHKCIEFVYGGCGGNDNRFYSLEECENKCKEH